MTVNIIFTDGTDLYFDNAYIKDVNLVGKIITLDFNGSGSMYMYDINDDPCKIDFYDVCDNILYTDRLTWPITLNNVDCAYVMR